MEEHKNYFFSVFSASFSDSAILCCLAGHCIDDARAKSLPVDNISELRMNGDRRTIPECRFDTCFDFLITYDKTALFISRDEHDTFVNTGIKLRNRSFSYEEDSN
jgi:hypothetical protein